MSKVVFWQVRIHIIAESLAAPGNSIGCANMRWAHHNTSIDNLKQNLRHGKYYHYYS